MNSDRRVVVTGLGALTPLGVGVEISWRAMCAGECGVGWITRYDASDMRTRVAGEIIDFNPKDFLTDRMTRRTDRYQQFALAAADMAIKDAGLRITPDIEDRVGVNIGTAVGGMETTVNGQVLFMNGARNEVSPFFVPMFLTGMATGQVAMMFGAKGPNFSSTTGCSAGTHAVGDAFRIIQRGEADVMLAGGAEAPIVPILFHSLGTIGATSTRSDEAHKASRPFDADRDGFVPAEGGAVLVLEEMQFALRRGARIHAEVAGYASTGDAYHVTSPSPGGEGAARCMRLAIQDADINPREVDYINAHGTSTKLNDSTETAAIKTVFDEHASRIPISSNKSMLGHSLGASGPVEAVFTILTMNEGVIPPTINYDTPDPECDLDYVPNVARRAKVRTALSNSFGFGGTNGVLVLRQFDDQY